MPVHYENTESAEVFQFDDFRKVWAVGKFRCLGCHQEYREVVDVRSPVIKDGCPSCKSLASNVIIMGKARTRRAAHMEELYGR